MNDVVETGLLPVAATFVATERDFVVKQFHVDEALDEPYRASVVVLADPDVHSHELLDQSGALEIQRGSTGRAIHGIVEHVSDRGLHDDKRELVLRLVPALSLLRYRTDTRIFTHDTVPNILRSVLGALERFGRPRPDFKLRRDYPCRDICVQYRETDLDFALRLMSEEGICFRFEERDGVEHMVLCDVRDEYGVDHDFLGIEPASATDEGLVELSHALGSRPDAVTVVGYSWRVPDALDIGRFPPGDLDPRDPYLQLFEHNQQHQVVDSSDNTPFLPSGATPSDRRAALRDARLRFEATLWRGRGNVTTLVPGSTFEVVSDDDIRDELRLCVVRLEQTGYIPVERGQGKYFYESKFSATAVDFVPRTRSSPRIFGPQTATVVGPPNEEIHVDPHGRIMVRFHWERLPPPTETDGWWVRCKQGWAGPGWGSFFVPRVGMEVVVEFLDGNPDSPLVTGCVYNSQNLAPYDLPDQKTISTLKSRSSPGGAGFNELRFEDAAGNEEIFLHAQKTMTEVVKGSWSQSVGGGRSATVGGTDTATVSGAQILDVKKDRTKTVSGNESRFVTGDRTTELGATDTTTTTGLTRRSLVGGLDTTINDHESRLVTGKSTLAVVGDRHVEVTGASSMQVSTTHDATAVTRYALAQGAAAKVVLEGGQVAASGSQGTRMSVGPADAPVAQVVCSPDGTIEIVANTSIALRCGDTTLTLGSDGTISLSAPQKLDLIGGDASSVAMSAAGVETSAPEIKSVANGSVEIQGAMVKIN